MEVKLDFEMESAKTQVDMQVNGQNLLPLVLNLQKWLKIVNLNRMPVLQVVALQNS